MNKEIKAKWLEALRSGNYAKAEGSLKKQNYKGTLCYCCLGVLQELLHPEEFTHRSGVFRAGLLFGFPTETVTIEAQLDRTDQRRLAYINDNSQGFNDVIKYIEENL